MVLPSLTFRIAHVGKQFIEFRQCINFHRFGMRSYLKHKRKRFQATVKFPVKAEKEILSSNIGALERASEK
ncbi:hypothetical protein D918_07798 [Trichuris suis]|nr:hypothetical protein D918_07798 [Trichuris suis]